MMHLHLVLFVLLTIALAAKPGSLQEIVEDDKLKFIFVGGKGGVGKTTTSAALAMLIAENMKNRASKQDKVLLVSTDPAHSLSDAFNQDFSSNGTGVPVMGYDRVSVIELNPKKALDKEMVFWIRLAKQAGLDEYVSQMSGLTKWLVSLPGIDEATALSTIVNRLQSSRYGAVIFDTAPTGHTLKLLELPPVLQAGLEQIQNAGGLMFQLKSMMSMFNQPMKDSPNKLKKNFEKRIELYKAGVQQVADMLQNHVTTTFVTVCIAEHLSIAESKRLLVDLAKNNVRSTHIVVNQMIQDIHEPGDVELVHADMSLPEAVRARVSGSLNLLTQRQALQRRHLMELLNDPEVSQTVVEVPMLAQEPAGREALEGFAKVLLPEKVPIDRSELDRSEL